MVASATSFLPFITYLLLFVIVRGSGCEWRRAAVSSAILWALCLTFITELVSLPHQLTRLGVAVCWLAIIALASTYFYKTRVPHSSRGLAGSRSVDFVQSRISDYATIGIFCGLGALMLVVGLTALLSPPNTGDVLFYHMPRVVMWISHQSTAFYPTLTYEQLIYAPWAEYAMLHLDLLFGSDRLVNLVQWFAYIGTCISVSLIARRLGASGRGQLLAAVACSSVPVILLQASGAKNDLVASFWISAAVYFLLEFGITPNWRNLSGFGAAASLAVFTKGTAYPVLPPLVIAGWAIATPTAKRRFLLQLPVLALFLLAVNGPLYLQNYRMTGYPTGVGTKDQGELLDFANRNHSVAGIAANIVRNLSVQINLPGSLNTGFQRMVVGTISLLGQDPSDPKSTKLTHIMGMQFQTNAFSAREDMAGAPIHLVLFLFVLIVLALHWREIPQVLWYSFGVIGAFILFCALLRWERWNVRYQMPVVALGCVVIGLIIDRYFSRWTPAVAVVLLLSAAPFALRNELRPLLPVKISMRRPILSWTRDNIFTQTRTELYFADLRQDLRVPYVSAAKAIQAQECRNVGVDVSFEDVDYPLYALLDVNQKKPNVWYSGVFNQTSAYARSDRPAPCAVVCFACAGVREKQDQYRSIGRHFALFGDLVIFSAAGQLSNPPTAPDPEAALSDRDLFAQVRQRLAAIKSMNSRPEYAKILHDAEDARHRWPEKSMELEVRLESINSMTRDAFTTMFNITSIGRRVALNQPISEPEHAALVGAAEALESLNTERMNRLADLGRFESHLRGSTGA